LEEAMAIARETVRLGLAARAQAKIKIRQPLAEAIVVADGPEREAIERLSEIVREELNVKRVRFVEGADELASYQIKANYRRLGPIFGKDMPQAAEAIAALDNAQVVAALRGERELGINVGGREHSLTSDDVILTMVAPDGYAVEREGAHAVALELAIDEELLQESRAREIVHAIQNARKQAGLEVEDRIALELAGDAVLVDAALAHRDYISNETLAPALEIAQASPPKGDPDGHPGHRERVLIEGMELDIALARTPAADPA
jgi:isoleucyl-tRNA synthetase